MNTKIHNIQEHIKAQKSFKYFCTEILGYKEDPEIGFYDLTETHFKLMERMENGGNHLILMPRESIKSQIYNIGYILWRLVKNPNLRILIYSDSATKAQGFLGGVKAHIEGKAPNSKFREMYPNWETDPHKGGTYNESRITVAPRKYDQKEPTVDTGGIEQSKVGMHYDIIIFDDIVSDLNITTKQQMDKTFECYRKSLSLLKRGGETIIIGTRWHFGDLYGRLLDENKEEKEFEEYIISGEAKVGGKLPFEDIGINEEFLATQKRKQGSYLFSCLYLNNPVNDDTAIFKIDDFQYYEPHPTFHENMWITCALDPAGEGDDFTAITVCGTDKDKNIYLLDAVNEHLKPNQIIDQIIRLNYKWGFDKFAVEKNFFKGLLEKQIREAVMEESKNENFRPFSVEEVIASAKQRTFTRVLSLQPWHEGGKIHLPGKSFNQLQKVYSELAFQMIQFTIDGSKSPHDDLLVSLSLHIEFINKGGEAKKKEPDETSAAWYERKCYEELQRSGIPIGYIGEPEFVFS